MLRRTYGTPMPSRVPTPTRRRCAPATAEAAHLEPVGHGDARVLHLSGAESLAAASEEDLRALGLGYRAAYIRQTTAILCERGECWLPSLRDLKEPEAVRQMLCELPGVGPKVGLRRALLARPARRDAVDTHVWDIACRDLDHTLTNCGSLTPKVYDRVGRSSARATARAGAPRSSLPASCRCAERCCPRTCRARWRRFARRSQARPSGGEAGARSERAATVHPVAALPAAHCRAAHVAGHGHGLVDGKQGRTTPRPRTKAAAAAATPTASSAAPVKRKRTVTPKREVVAHGRRRGDEYGCEQSAGAQTEIEEVRIICGVPSVNCRRRHVSYG